MLYVLRFGTMLKITDSGWHSNQSGICGLFSFVYVFVTMQYLAIIIIIYIQFECLRHDFFRFVYFKIQINN